MDAREINIQVPPKQGADKGQGVIDLSNPTQMASEVFRFANGGKGATLQNMYLTHFLFTICFTVLDRSISPCGRLLIFILPCSRCWQKD
jgi:hypothetical protein